MKAKNTPKNHPSADLSNLKRDKKHKETCRDVWIYLEMIAQYPRVRVINEIKTTVLASFYSLFIRLG